MKKPILFVAGFIIVAVPVLMILISPYKQDRLSYRAVTCSVDIQKPAHHVYEVLGNSTNARKWSTFVHHISPINEVTDGQVGSKRRCFVRGDETGIQWDEEIVIVEPAVRRRLTIFNMQNFTLTAEGLATEEIYEPLDSAVCRLTFSLFFIHDNPSFLDLLKMKYSAFEVRNIFEKNLSNIKHLAEAGDDYQRIYPLTEQ